jgi:hypothetical protein
MSKTFTITQQAYLDQINKCYRNILVVNLHPQGPLSAFVRQLHFPKLSPYQVDSPCCPIPKCGMAIVSLTDPEEWMCPEEIPELISYLLANGYQMETQITSMLNYNSKKTMYTITYYGTAAPNVMYMR